MSAPDCREMLDRDDARLSIRRQCAMLGVSRSSVYRPKNPANDNDLAWMRRLDELFTAWPFLGVDGGLNPRLSGGGAKTGTRFALKSWRAECGAIDPCQRRKPPEAVAKGQRLQGSIAR